MGKREAPGEHRWLPKEYFKRLVEFLVANGVAWIWCSYILAFLGRTQIAEDLSKIAVTEIIAVALVYAIKSLCENTLKYNSFDFKKKKTTVEPEETV